MKHYEEFEIGERTELGSYLFTAEEIVSFASQWDPQTFHLDVQAAAAGPFGGLCASGWHTASVWMKLCVAHAKSVRRQRAEAGLPTPALGPSPGFEDLHWRRPVYAGDTLAYSSEVSGKRALATRPGWGLVTMRNEAVNQNGDLVFAFTGKVFVQMRGVGGAGQSSAR